MIPLHRINNSEFWLNHRHIETVQANPDTVITLTNDRKYVVKETPEQIADLITEYHGKIFKVNLLESVDI